MLDKLPENHKMFYSSTKVINLSTTTPPPPPSVYSSLLLCTVRNFELFLPESGPEHMGEDESIELSTTDSFRLMLQCIVEGKENSLQSMYATHSITWTVRFISHDFVLTPASFSCWSFVWTYALILLESAMSLTITSQKWRLDSPKRSFSNSRLRTYINRNNTTVVATKNEKYTHNKVYIVLLVVFVAFEVAYKFHFSTTVSLAVKAV